jgi:DNA-binding MarR family transcriptional regulator
MSFSYNLSAPVGDKMMKLPMNNWMIILYNLHSLEIRTFAELGFDNGISYTSLLNNVKHMQTMGWLTIITDEEDKRRRYIYLTDKGKLVRRRVRQLYQSIQSEEDKP